MANAPTCDGFSVSALGERHWAAHCQSAAVAHTSNFSVRRLVVAKPEWGTKRICPSCGTRYYDMRKDPPVCPSCATVFDPEALLKSRRARPIPADDTKKTPAAARDDDEAALDTEEGIEEAALDEVEPTLDADEVDADVIPDDVVVEEDEDVLLEDTEELDDGDDMGEVVDVETDEEV